MDTALFEFLKSRGLEKYVKRDEPMSRHTTFRVGGAADFFVEIGSPDELMDIINNLTETDPD